MDLGLTEIQQMLKNSAQEFLGQECPLTLVRELEEDPRGYTDELWRQMVGLGWTGLPFSEEYGGTGGSFMDMAVLLEEMGKALVPGPFFSTVVLGGLTVAEAGTSEQKREILPGICAGSLRLTLALTEPSATYEPWGVETTATAKGGGYILSGTKLFVPYAHAADILLVAARTSPGSGSSEGITVFLVPADSPGLKVDVLRSIASDKPCEVLLEQVRVSNDSILGELDQGWPVVHRALQRAATATCTQMLEGARRHCGHDGGLRYPAHPIWPSHWQFFRRYSTNAPGWPPTWKAAAISFIWQRGPFRKDCLRNGRWLWPRLGPARRTSGFATRLISATAQLALPKSTTCSCTPGAPRLWNCPMGTSKPTGKPSFSK